MVIAGVQAILQLGFLAAYPVWSILIIALDVVVIYALIVHGREMADRWPAGEVGVPREGGSYEIGSADA